MQKESDAVNILGVTFDSKMTLRSIIARFPEQLLKGFVTRGIPGDYSMIDCFLAEPIVVL